MQKQNNFILYYNLVIGLSKGRRIRIFTIKTPSAFIRIIGKILQPEFRSQCWRQLASSPKIKRQKTQPRRKTCGRITLVKGHHCVRNCVLGVKCLKYDVNQIIHSILIFAKLKFKIVLTVPHVMIDFWIGLNFQQRIQFVFFLLLHSYFSLIRNHFKDLPIQTEGQYLRVLCYSYKSIT